MLKEVNREENEAAALVLQYDANGPGAAYTGGAPADAPPPYEAPIAPIVLSIRTVNGQVVTVALSGAATTSDLMQSLENDFDIPVSFQRLVFNGRELSEPTDRLVGLGVQDGCLMHLLLKTKPVTPVPQPEEYSEFADIRPVNPSDITRAEEASRGSRDAMSINYAIVSNHPAHSLALDPTPGSSSLRQQRMLKTFYLGCSVKTFTVVDGLFLVFLCFIWVPFAAGVILCMCGLFGSHVYQPYLVLLFAMYLFLSISVRLVFMIVLGSAYPWSSLLLGFGICVEVYILKITIEFLNMIKMLNVEDRAELMQLRVAARDGDIIDMSFLGILGGPRQPTADG